MPQKILKVGTSAAVTIPKNSLAELGLRIGDSVNVAVDAERKIFIVEPFTQKIDPETVKWARDFIKRYRPALEALAKK